MGAMTLLVDRRGAELSLSKSGQVVCLRDPDGAQHRVGLLALRRIVICGDVNIPSALLRACDETEVSVVLLPMRGKGNNVNLFPYMKNNFNIRLAQYRAYFDKQVRLSLARQMVAAKIRMQKQWLLHHNLKCDFDNALAKLANASDNASIMGIEGSVARDYFALWRQLWGKAWRFNERNRRPPLDPVNALLSLSYTLAGNSVGQWVTSRGLDVSVGFLHTPHLDRPSLALDLLEPVRPWVDQWLCQQIEAGLLTPKQFTFRPKEGCRLDSTGRSAFFPAWYDDAETWLEKPIRDSLAQLLKTLRNYNTSSDE